MTLESWLDNAWIRREKTSPNEISALLEKIDRDISTAQIEHIPVDWRLAIAYNACLACAHTALRATGHRLPEQTGHHYKAIESLRFTLTIDSETIETLQAIRKKRHIVTYDAAGTASEIEVGEVLKIARDLRRTLDEWLESRHSELI